MGGTACLNRNRSVPAVAFVAVGGIAALGRALPVLLFRAASAVGALPVVLAGVLLCGIAVSVCSLFVQEIHPLYGPIVCKGWEHYTNFLWS